MPVAGYVAARFGPEVVDRLVDPLLGGVYAGRSEELSFEATLPALAEASRQHASLAAAAAALLPPPPPAAACGPGPPPAVFTSLAGGPRHPAARAGRRLRRASCAPARWCASWPARPAAGG